MDCTVTVTNGELPPEEIQAYIDRARKLYGREPKHIDIRVCGDEVELDYAFGYAPFQRLRRITGYLVGDMGRWNSGKRAEERERVKHGVGER